MRSDTVRRLVTLFIVLAVAVLGLSPAASAAEEPVGAAPTGSEAAAATPSEEAVEGPGAVEPPTPAGTGEATPAPSSSSTPPPAAEDDDEQDGPGESGGEEEPPGPPEAEAPEEGRFEIDNAQFRWGINDESNNSAFNPGTFNLFSAGKLANPDAGGQTLNNNDGGRTWSNGKAANWRAQAGNVRIEKAQPDGSWATTTWAGTRTDVNGGSLGTAYTERFSNHQIVIDGGQGWYDTTTNEATIAWSGDFSVIYYSGMTFFYVSNPVLTIDAQGARIDATLSGFGSDIIDQSKWIPVPPTSVRLADLDASAIDLGAELGFTATPRYRGVSVDLPAGSTQQVRSGDAWGSFPASFVAFQGKAGSGSYWYSSGGATDRFKVASDVTISYDAGRPITPETPPEPTGGAEPVSNDFVAPPPQAPATAGPAATASTPRGAANTPSVTPPEVKSAPARVGTSLPFRLTQSLLPEGASGAWAWWAGGFLLLISALLAGLAPFAVARRHRPKT